MPRGSGGSPTKSATHDPNGNVSSRVDWNGNRTNYSYDLSRNLETQRVEGLSSAGAVTAVTRTVSTEWHGSFRLPKRVAEPLRLTTYGYNGDGGASCGFKADGVTRVLGVVCSKRVEATTDANGSQGFGATVVGTPRVWTWTYNANGSVLTEDGPRTDVADITAYSYYANDASCPGASALGCRGQVATISNAAGHVTQITEYNAHGQPLTILDANGVTTTLTYDARMRLTARSVGGETTGYQYDGVGQLIRVTLPDGSALAYTYDAAHRLTEIADHLGNKVVYTLDAMGNRIKEEVKNPAGAIVQMKSREFNALNRLVKEIGGTNPTAQITQYGYDNQGNVTSIDGPLNNATANDVRTYTYDALNRLATLVDPGGSGGGTTRLAYNGQDQLVAVTDPRSLVTSYGVDGLGNRTQLASPDTGTTVSSYDAAGNVLTQTDAQGQVTTYTYDALNRVASITYQGGVTHSFQYDQGVNGIGRLTTVSEPSSTTRYGYDAKGRLVSETRTINGVTYTTGYGYDSAGRLTGITYPSGRQITYTLDGLGRVQQIDTIQNLTAQTVVSGVTYQPFGPVQGFTYGNGQLYSRGFDMDGRFVSYTLGNQTFAVGYDAASRITSLTDAGNPANANSYGYDAIDRLTSFVGPSANQAFSYDAVGNRVSKTIGVSTDTYAYAPTSNRLSAITGSVNRSYSYDANGSTTGDGSHTFGYDARGRLVQASAALGTTTYQVNALGQRIRKSNAQGDTVYHYDSQGRLIAESHPSGAVQREYIYLGDSPVAVIQ